MQISERIHRLGMTIGEMERNHQNGTICHTLVIDLIPILIAQQNARMIGKMTETENGKEIGTETEKEIEIAEIEARIEIINIRNGVEAIPDQLR